MNNVLNSFSIVIEVLALVAFVFFVINILTKKWNNKIKNLNLNQLIFINIFFVIIILLLLGGSYAFRDVVGITNLKLRSDGKYVYNVYFENIQNDNSYYKPVSLQKEGSKYYLNTIYWNDDSTYSPSDTIKLKLNKRVKMCLDYNTDYCYYLTLTNNAMALKGVKTTKSSQLSIIMVFVSTAIIIMLWGYILIIFSIKNKSTLDVIYKCPDCGAIISENDERCDNCGCELVWSEE